MDSDRLVVADMIGGGTATGGPHAQPDRQSRPTPLYLAAEIPGSATRYARAALTLAVLAALIFGLPLAGAEVAGVPVAPHLELPPRVTYARHAPFSWPVFFGLSALGLISIAPFVYWGLARLRRLPSLARTARRLPWWGYVSLLILGAAWILAYSRFAWFTRIQGHTFLILWIAYIVATNAWTYQRTGGSLLLDRPYFFLLLFPASAVFWWYFEYINTFTHNWSYVSKAPLSPRAFFVAASVCFSTVLPAVLSTQELLNSLSPFSQGFHGLGPLPTKGSRWSGGALLLLAGAGMTGIGVWPEYLFPLVWTAPLLLIVALQAARGERHILSGAAEGDWRQVVSAGLAALICGFFWEMWNYYSERKWVYSIPYVQRYYIFQMPLLGFLGYIPFGLQCAAVASMVEWLPLPRAWKQQMRGAAS